MFAETRLFVEKPIAKFQSNLSKHLVSVTWQNNLDNSSIVVTVMVLTGCTLKLKTC